MLPEFLSHRADTKEQAVVLLSALEDVSVLAGGTDLLVRMGRGETHRHIIDIAGIPDLRIIECEDDALCVGSLVSHSAVHVNPLIREGAFSLSEACGLVGSPQIRNMGTIGGNLVNASPAADSLSPLLIHDARIVLESTGKKRTVGLEDFIIDPYRTSIRSDELLTFIEIKGLKGDREGYRRVAKRATWAISRLSVAWAVKEKGGCYEDVRLAIGSCTPMPFRPREVEQFLTGKEKSPRVQEEAVAMIVGGIRRASGDRPSFGTRYLSLRRCSMRY